MKGQELLALEIEEWRLRLGYLGSMDESPSIDEQATAGSAATSKIRGKKDLECAQCCRFKETKNSRLVLRSEDVAEW